jgi:RNA polymerase sigma-70 factor (ECF subfamily)
MQQPAPSDQELIEAVVRRDETALRQLYDRYGALIFTLALRKLGDRGAAEEVLQDVFVRCWEHAGSYKTGAGTVVAWLFGIARNRAIDVRRSRLMHTRDREQEQLPDSDALRGIVDTGGADDVERVALRLSVAAALDELSPPQRQAIAMAYYDDLSQSEIARRLGEPLGTVKTRIRAGMERMRRSLAPHMPPEAEAQVSQLHD